MVFSERMNTYLMRISEMLECYLPDIPIAQAGLIDSMHYSLMAGGKMIRPILALEFCRVCGADYAKALPFACAVEMVHVYSLIHDDLPCMDDDDLRRGRPTNHMIFGESTALLAGDALLSCAFETMLDPENLKGIAPEAAISAAHRLAWASGVFGMAGGQYLDLKSEQEDLPIEGVTQIHRLKTGALISAAAEIGCIVAGASKEKVDSAVSFAQNIGLAFQIKDDILNLEGDASKLGKATGTDIINGKMTFVKLLGIEECKSLVEGLTNSAKDNIACFQENDFLLELADMLAQREH